MSLRKDDEKMMKGLWRVLLAALLVCMLGSSAAFAKGAKQEAEPAMPQAPETPPQGVFIADYANVVSEADREEMAALGRELKQKYGVWLICLTEDALEDAPLGLYAGTVRTAWGMGENDGLLLFIRRGRRLHFANGKALAEKLTRERLDAAVAPAADEIIKGQLSTALTRIFHNMVMAIAAGHAPAGALEGAAAEAPPAEDQENIEEPQAEEEGKDEGHE